MKFVVSRVLIVPFLPEGFSEIKIDFAYQFSLPLSQEYLSEIGIENRI